MERIDSRELSEWMLYERIEPFGERRADLRAAIVAAATTNAVVQTAPFLKKKPALVSYTDFMPQFEASEPDPEQERIERASSLRKLASALGAKVVRHGDPS